MDEKTLGMVLAVICGVIAMVLFSKNVTRAKRRNKEGRCARCGEILPSDAQIVDIGKRPDGLPSYNIQVVMCSECISGPRMLSPWMLILIFLLLFFFVITIKSTLPTSGSNDLSFSRDELMTAIRGKGK